MRQALIESCLADYVMTIVDFAPLTIDVPLREEPAGVIRVGKSRVLLELVIRAFQAGATPEAIVQAYDTLNLADVYAVAGRYLTNPAPFDQYLRDCDQNAAKTRSKIEAEQAPQGNLREILLARQAKSLTANRSSGEGPIRRRDRRWRAGRSRAGARAD